MTRHKKIWEALSKEQTELLRGHGQQVHAKGLPQTENPYIAHTPAAMAWAFGWWKAEYAQREGDARMISLWLQDECDVIFNKSQADAIASFLTNMGNYDRKQPVLDNRIGGREFTIPAPAFMKGVK